MPEIARFFGIVIAMFWKEHGRPHFHARYGDQKGVFFIDPVYMSEGNLSPRAQALIVEWATIHKHNLLENWDRARRHESLLPIEGL